VAPARRSTAAKSVVPRPVIEARDVAVFIVSP